MKIALICGSPSNKSHTHALLKYIEGLLTDKKVETLFWELKIKPLPVVQPQYHSNPIETPDEKVKEFVRFVDDVDGLVLGTPIYHGSYAGILKNAVDNLGPDALETKRSAWLVTEAPYEVLKPVNTSDLLFAPCMATRLKLKLRPPTPTTRTMARNMF